MYELNDQQRLAAEFTNGVAIVIAIPGSGKTITLTHRIANLVQIGVAPETILGITFTKNAANTLRNRLESLINFQASRITLSTIHSLCYRILKNEGKLFQLLDDFQKLVFLRRVMKKIVKASDLPASLVLSKISLAKNCLVSPEQFLATYGHDSTLYRIGIVYQAYEHEKDINHQIDFEDLLTDTYDLLTIEEVCKKYQNIYMHLLIDEYQDTNPVMVEIVKRLVNGNGSLFVVGDDSQSIYSFTGASVDNIINFKKKFPKSEEFRLTLNYRSTPQILQACSNLIANNKYKIDKELTTNNPDGEDVVVLEASTEEAEAILVALEIQGIIARLQINFKDIVILYRANFQSRSIEETLLKMNIPYKVENGQNFYQCKDIRHLLDYLRVVHDPLSDIGDQGLLNVLNFPNRFLGNRFKSELKKYATVHGLRIYSALQQMPIAIPYEQDNSRKFVCNLGTLIERAPKMPPAEMIKLIRSTFDYDKAVIENDLLMPDDPKIANLDQLQVSAAKFDNSGQFLKYVENFQKPNVVTNNNCVTLMTIHKSKGMEFPVVFIIGMVNGLIPLTKGEIEEERRIAFVGLSRASKILHLSYSHTYNNMSATKSVLITEMKL